ncbi:hypothetical protein HZH66_009991 [Vespula vulgaris]|uniref:Ig-like domain-containing protein n=1 Tax=Vespula vulgaris TaxID=7454 RepID=A0A834JIE4_VESVU|nr:hypothetical protein HZH66_009991 [Vespula vulgaris]
MSTHEPLVESPVALDDLTNVSTVNEIGGGKGCLTNSLIRTIRALVGGPVGSTNVDNRARSLHFKSNSDHQSIYTVFPYDLESDKLYSFSWYKDHEEFYRYVPRSEPTQHSYHVEGIKVDMIHGYSRMKSMTFDEDLAGLIYSLNYGRVGLVSPPFHQKRLFVSSSSFRFWNDEEILRLRLPTGRQTTYFVSRLRIHRYSDHRRVQLEDVGLYTSGRYKCEVVAEAPNFNSVIAEANMEVVVLPEESPTITGEEKIYASGDVLALNCTSGRSHPGAHLKWFINGVQVKADSERRHEQHGLISTISSLRLELEPDHLSSEKIKVRCEAVVRSSQETNDSFIDSRATEVFVQGQSSLLRPSACLLVTLLLLQRLLVPH